MPLQEDYLNELLNELTDNLEEPTLFDENDDIAPEDTAESTVEAVMEDDALAAFLEEASLAAGSEDGMLSVDLEDAIEDSIIEDTVIDDAAIEESVVEDFAADENAMEASDLEDTMAEDHDDLEELLRAAEEFGAQDEAQDEAQEPQDTVEEMDDLMSLLGGSDEADLQEIHDLLQKADNNETIDSGDLAENDGVGPDALLTENDVNAETAGQVEGKKTAEEKKLERQAKKEAAKAAKAAKKEEKRLQKEAKKEAAKAAKALKKAGTNEDASAEDGIQFAKIEDVEAIDAGIHETDGADDIFADLALLDVLGEDMTEGKSSVAEVSETAGEDSLAQIVDNHKKAQKKGVFARIVSFLTEEDEEEEESVKLSEENRDILKEMKKEDKKKKKKNLKKAKNAEASEEDGEDGEEADDKGKGKKKAKKEKKPKKEKAPKLEDAEEPKKKLSLKKVASVMGLCLGIAVAIIICTDLAGEYSAKKAGKDAYYEGDYQTCYQNFYGKELNENEQVMYSKSESILRIRLWIREYEMLAEQGLEVEALDSLIQSVYEYPTLYDYASKWNASTEVGEYYNLILEILSDKYRLTEEQALEIANERRDVVYTKMIMAIADGEAYGSWIDPDVSDIVILPDELPEESGLGQSEFVDNNPGK